VGTVGRRPAPEVQERGFSEADERAALAVRIAKNGVPPEGPLAMLKRAPELRGPELFDKHCAGCHTLGTHGAEKDRVAPKLDGWGTDAFVMGMLKDPDHDDRFGRTPYKGEMPSVQGKMPEDDQKAVARFVATGSDEKGKKIVTTGCTTCHLYKGEGDESGTGLAPELDGWGTLAWVKAQIGNPSSKATYRENALDPARKGHMPRFDAETSAEDINILARWLLSQTKGAPLQ